MSDLPTAASDNEKSAQFVKELIEAEYNELYRFLLTRLNNDEDEVCDCIMQIYEIALKKAEKLQKNNNPNGWLYKKAQLCAKHRLSAHKSKPTIVSLEDYINTLAYEQSFFDDEDIDQQAVEAAKKRCLAVLTATELATYELFYVQKMPIKQIAEKLGHSESAVGVRLYRIRIKLTDEVNKTF